MLTQRLIQQVHLRECSNLDMDGDQQPNLSQGQRRREEERRREGGGGERGEEKGGRRREGGREEEGGGRREGGRRKGGGGERRGMGRGKHEYQPATSSQIYHQVGGRRKSIELAISLTCQKLGAGVGCLQILLSESNQSCSEDCLGGGGGTRIVFAVKHLSR